MADTEVQSGVASGLTARPQTEAGEGATPSSVASTLRTAADLLDKPGAWTQGAYGRDEGGQTVWSTSGVVERATCRCAIGAIMVAGLLRSGEAENSEATQFLHSHLGLGEESVVDWNDAPERTQAEVVAAFRDAASKATGEQA